LVQGTHVGIELDHGGVGGGGDPLTLIDPYATGFGFITSLVRREVVDSVDTPLQVIGDIGTGPEGRTEVDLDPGSVGIEGGGEIAKDAAIEVGGIAAGRIVEVMNKKRLAGRDGDGIETGGGAVSADLILIVSAEAPTGEALRSGALVVHFHHAGHEVDGL
jgi:hypothetical protein